MAARDRFAPRALRRREADFLNHFRVDSWSNSMTGIGRPGYDRTVGNVVSYFRMPVQLAEQIFAGDNLARKIVQKIVRSALRKDFKVKVSEFGAESNERFNDDFKRLLMRFGLTQRKEGMPPGIQTAAEWGRLYGSSYLLVNADDGRKMEQPLNTKNIRRIRWIRPFTPRELYSFIRNWSTDKNYLEPEFYTFITYGSPLIEKVHYSRIIRFIGHELPRYLYMANAFVHDSVLNRVQEALGDYAIAIKSAGYALSEYSQGVYKMKGLASSLAGKDFSTVRNRFRAMNEARSIVRSMVVDEKEDFQRLAGTAYSGMSELITSIQNDLAARTEIPRTILFNEFAGHEQALISNANGENEQSEWMASVSEYQELRLKDPIKRLCQILLADQSNEVTRGDVPDFDISFRSDRQRTMMEEAAIYETISATDNANIQQGVLSAEEIRNIRYSRAGTFADMSLFAGQKLSNKLPVSPQQQMQEQQMQQQLALAAAQQAGGGQAQGGQVRGRGGPARRGGQRVQ